MIYAIRDALFAMQTASRERARGGKFIADSIGCAMKIYGIGQRMSAQLAKSSFQILHAELGTA
jgi:hypothetical protein